MSQTTNETVTVNLKDFPDDLHTNVKQHQLNKKKAGEKLSLNESIYDLVRLGYETTLEKGGQK